MLEQLTIIANSLEELSIAVYLASDKVVHGADLETQTGKIIPLTIL